MRLLHVLSHGCCALLAMHLFSVPLLHPSSYRPSLLRLAREGLHHDTYRSIPVGDHMENADVRNLPLRKTAYWDLVFSKNQLPHLLSNWLHAAIRANGTVWPSTSSSPQNDHDIPFFPAYVPQTILCNQKQSLDLPHGQIHR